MANIGDILLNKNAEKSGWQMFDGSGNIVELGENCRVAEYVVQAVDGSGNPTQISELIGSSGSGSGSSSISVEPSAIQGEPILRTLTSGTITNSGFTELMPSNTARVGWYLENYTGDAIVVAIGGSGSEEIIARVADGGRFPDSANGDAKFITQERISVGTVTSASISLTSARDGLTVIAREWSNT